jgi:hypothetical protein
LHALLIAASCLLGFAVPFKLLAAAAVAGHGVLRRPRVPPRVVIVTADGSYAVPEWASQLRPLGRRTLVCPFWIRLDVGAPGRQRDILLLVDQLTPEAWRRLRALLMRMRCD